MKALLIAITAAAAFLINPHTAQAAMKAVLQGQSYGSTNWVNNNLTGWHELEYIPVRIYLTGGPAVNQSIRVDFDHSKGTTPGIQNLTEFSTENVSFNSGPTLQSPASDTWSYTFNINLTAASGWVEFRARLAAGSHYFGGSSLSLSGTPSLGVLQISKPAPVPGDPDLAITKAGPTHANPGSLITYTLSYTNRAGSPGTGVQVVDTLPQMVQFVSGSGSFQQLGNTIIWDLEDLPRGNSGSFTYSVMVTNNALNGQSFQNYASILSAENDVNSSNNSASVITTIVNGCIPPQITLQPLSVQSCPGSNVVLSVLGNGTAPLSYQWSKDGEVLLGATSNQVVIANVSGANIGDYTATISNACGVVVSAVATISLAQTTVATPLENITNCVGGTASFSTVASGSGPVSYAWYKDGAILTGQTNNTLVLDPITPQHEGAYSVVVSGRCSAVTNSASLFISSVAATPLTDVAQCPGGTASFQTTASGDGPFTYTWLKGGAVLNGKTSQALTLNSITAEDAGVYTVIVSGVCQSVTNSAVLSILQQTHATPLANLELCSGSTAVFETFASGSGPFSYLWSKEGQILTGQTEQMLTLPDISEGDAGLYSVVVSGSCGSLTNSATLTIKEKTAATPLQDLTVCLGSSATFSTIASGSGPFSYAWYKDGIILAGESGSTLSISAASNEDAGEYSVVVNGACYSITNTASLNFYEVAESTGLVDVTHCVGETVLFAPVISGTGPFSFIWRKDGVVLVGEEGNSLLLESITTANTGEYSVEITALCNTITNSAFLSVNQPAAATPLNSVTHCPGEDVTFSTVASGTG
ncbi:MAG: hypothetical protein ACK4UN_10955, partial [Limisphaerales bacterium]